MMESGWLLSSARVFLIALGLLLIYLGWKGVLEPMVMIPMGLGMVAINCGTLFMPDGTLGNLFLDPMLSDTDDLMNTMQIDFLQPVYTLTFSNGLIACFVFMGIGTLLDVGFLLQKPFASIFLALCANEVIATMLGNFQDGTVAGKIQFGSGWWFLDQKDGMEKQMNALSVLGLLSRFVGMLTDSRSFLSYPRHEYFRRTLCNLVGRDVENGEIPVAEMERVNQMIEDISYYNAKKFFQF